MKRCGAQKIKENSLAFHKKATILSVPGANTRVVVPVVFHVVGNASVQSLISDARLSEQLKQLNQDYSMTNPDISSVPSPFVPWLPNIPKISFELSRIVRQSATGPFIANLDDVCNDPIKLYSSGGSNSIDTNKNMNVWIGNVYESEPYDLLGYATFPWFRDLGECYKNTDGIVLHYETVGSVASPNPGALAPYDLNLGRTLTHEAGHYFGLFHMWDDCDPSVCCRTLPNLPAQKGSNLGKPSFPHRANTCPASSTSPASQHGDMFMNYMDYVDDDVMVMFSESQMDLAVQMAMSYRAEMVKEFNSISTSNLNLTGLTSAKNDDLYQCVVISGDGSVLLSSDIVKVTTN